MSTMIVGYDTTFELNEFKEPRIRSEIETVKDIILFILFSKKGQYPSLPMIGMDIGSMLYSHYDELNPDAIKEELKEQCEVLGCYFDSGSVTITKKIYKKIPSLIIYITGKETYPSGYMKDNYRSNQYLIGITYDELNRLIYDIKEGSDIRW